MKVLQAPTEATVDRTTSVGTVSFKEGMATEFTDEQAEFFCSKIPGYSVIDIPDGEEAKPEEETNKEGSESKSESSSDKSSEGGIVDKLKDGAKAVVSAVMGEEPKTVEDTPGSTDHIQGNLHGLVGAVVHLVDISTGNIVSETTTDENGHWEFADPGEGDFNIAFFGEGIEPEDDITGAEVGQTYPLEAVSESDNGTNEAAGIFGNIRGLSGIEVSYANADGGHLGTTVTDENGNWQFDDIEDGAYIVGFSGEGVDHNDVLYGNVENGVWSLLPGSLEEGSQEHPLDAAAQTSENTATSSDVKKEVEEVKLPTVSDGRRKIAKWCRENGIADTGSKKDLLLRIHEDSRFKK